MPATISDIADDILTKVKAISELSGRVGLAVGGQEIDPQLRDLPRPAAWILYMGDTPEVGNTPANCVIPIVHNFDVLILIDYDLDEPKLKDDFDTLNTIIREIKGTDGPLGTQSWFYQGQSLSFLDSDRQVWTQSYNIRSVV